MKTNKEYQLFYGSEIRRIREGLQLNFKQTVEKLHNTDKKYTGLTISYIKSLEAGVFCTAAWYKDVLTLLGYATDLDPVFQEWEKRVFCCDVAVQKLIHTANFGEEDLDK